MKRKGCNVMSQSKKAAKHGDDPAMLPFVIGVTGQRDLPDSARDPLRAVLRRELRHLQDMMPNTPLLVRSMLAEGVARLVVEVATEQGIAFEAVLPMALEEYRQDFGSAASRQGFERLIGQVRRTYIVRDVPHHETDRSARYRYCGKHIAGPCHLLLALWDPFLD